MSSIAMLALFIYHVQAIGASRLPRSGSVYLCMWKNLVRVSHICNVCITREGDPHKLEISIMKEVIGANSRNHKHPELILVKQQSSCRTNNLHVVQIILLSNINLPGSILMKQ